MIWQEVIELIKMYNIFKLLIAFVKKIIVPLHTTQNVEQILTFVVHVFRTFMVMSACHNIEKIK